jgi:hypothetical protein
LLNEIIILSDIAELAFEADMEYSSGASTDKYDTLNRPALSRIRWKSLRFNDKTRSIDDSISKSANGNVDAAENESAGDNEDDDDEISGIRSLPGRSSQMKRQVSDMKNQLDRWEEPIDKSFEVSSSKVSFWRDWKNHFVLHSPVRIFADTEYFNG